MGRIVTPVFIANALDPSKQIHCDVLVDTGASGLVLPSAWKDRLQMPRVRSIEMETADQRVLSGEVCGPARIQIEGFDVIFNEVTFIDMAAANGGYAPLLGHIILEQSRAAVDMVGHRLVPVKHADLKRV
jgi:predicted aspartyl protease